jgi:hypothetical protein
MFRQSEEDLQLKTELEMLLERLKVFLAIHLCCGYTGNWCNRNPTPSSIGPLLRPFER